MRKAQPPEGVSRSRGVSRPVEGPRPANSTAHLAPDLLCIATNLPDALDFSWPLSETPSPHP